MFLIASLFFSCLLCCSSGRRSPTRLDYVRWCVHLAFSASTTSGQCSGTSQTSDDDGAERCYRGKYRWRALAIPSCLVVFLLLLFLLSVVFRRILSFFPLSFLFLCLVFSFFPYRFEALSIISSAEPKEKIFFFFVSLLVDSVWQCHCLPPQSIHLVVAFFVLPLVVCKHIKMSPLFCLFVEDRGSLDATSASRQQLKETVKIIWLFLAFLFLSPLYPLLFLFLFYIFFFFSFLLLFWLWSLLPIHITLLASVRACAAATDRSPSSIGQYLVILSF